VPPQNSGPGGTLWSLPSQNFCRHMLLDLKSCQGLKIGSSTRPVLDLSHFSWGGGRIEAPKAPMGVECGEGVSPPHGGRGLGKGTVPSPEKFLVFDLKMVNFGAF